jgi:multidrug efflux pump subunit AcrB
MAYRTKSCTLRFPELSQLGLPRDAIANTLAGQNLVGSGGSVEVGSQYIRIQPTGELKSVEERH